MLGICKLVSPILFSYAVTAMVSNQYYAKSSIRNVKLSAPALYAEDNSTLRSCFKICLQDVRCVAFHFETTGNQTCEILDNSDCDGWGFNSAVGWNYYALGYNEQTNRDEIFNTMKNCAAEGFCRQECAAYSAVNRDRRIRARKCTQGGGCESRAMVCESGLCRCRRDFSQVANRCVREEEWHVGKTFIVAFMRNRNTDRWSKLALHLTAVPGFADQEQDSHHTYNVTAPLFDPVWMSEGNLTTHGSQLVLLRSDLELNSTEGTDNRGILVETSAYVTVAAESTKRFCSDMFLVMPTTSLGREYYVMTWKSMSSVLIVASEDNTTISMTTPGSTVVSIEGNYLLPGSNYQTRLEKYETFFMHEDHSDFTSMAITTDKPIGIFCGSLKASVSDVILQGDHIVSQLPPSNTWGYTHVLFNAPGPEDMIEYRVLTQQQNTTIRVAYGTSIQVYFLKGRLSTMEFSIDSRYGFSSIVADKPVLVGAFVESPELRNTDPALTYITPTEQFSSGPFYLATPLTSKGIEYENNLIFVIEEVKKNGLCLDNETIAPNWSKLQNIAGYVAAAFPVSGNTDHVISHVDPFTKFLSIGYGWSRKESYMLTLGRNYIDLTTV